VSVAYLKNHIYRQTGIHLSPTAPQKSPSVPDCAVKQQWGHRPSGRWIFSQGGVCIPSLTAPLKPRPSGRGSALLPA